MGTILPSVSLYYARHPPGGVKHRLFTNAHGRPAWVPKTELTLALPDLSNGMDRSCEATIYPVLDKPLAIGALQDRGKIEALLRSSSSFG